MGEHNQHRQRVYNRFLREGLMGFEEHNAMEFLLFSGTCARRYKQSRTPCYQHLWQPFRSAGRTV